MEKFVSTSFHFLNLFPFNEKKNSTRTFSQRFFGNKMTAKKPNESIPFHFKNGIREIGIEKKGNLKYVRFLVSVFVFLKIPTAVFLKLSTK